MRMINLMAAAFLLFATGQHCFAQKCEDLFKLASEMPAGMRERYAELQNQALAAAMLNAARAPKPEVRLPIDFNDISKTIKIMSEGEPEAALLLGRMLKEGYWIEVLSLDDMNIRGKQLIVAYYRYAEQNLDRLISGIQSRDPALVQLVNSAMGGTFPFTAVSHGAGR